jgi:hypothetical protein
VGNKLFGVDISGLVAKHIAPGLLDVTLTTWALGNRTAGKLAEGRARVPTVHDRGIKGMWEDISPALVDGQQILVGDRIGFLIGDTIPAGVVLKTNDQITIEGLSLYVIRLLRRDPAAATYRYLCRDRKGPDGA